MAEATADAEPAPVAEPVVVSADVPSDTAGGANDAADSPETTTES